MLLHGLNSIGIFLNFDFTLLIVLLRKLTLLHSPFEFFGLYLKFDLD